MQGTPVTPALCQRRRKRLARPLAVNVDSFGNNVPVVGTWLKTVSSFLLMVNCASKPVFIRK
jgi:hypothetical protein